MAFWKCEKCGATKDSRCKPKKCPSCGEANTMIKEMGTEERSSSCGAKRGGCKKKMT